MHSDRVKRDTTLRFNRPNDRRLAEYMQTAKAYIDALALHFQPLRTYFATADVEAAAYRSRSATKGGHLLFRPIGLEIVTRACTAYADHHKCSIADAVAIVSNIETRLDRKPHRDVIWDPIRERMIVKNKILARRLVFHCLGLPEDEDKLIRDYAVATGSTPGKTKLPPRVV